MTCFNRCREPGSLMLQQNITIGSRIGRACERHLASLREHLPAHLCDIFLPKRDVDPRVPDVSAYLQARVRETLMSANRRSGFTGCSGAQRAALQALRCDLRRETGGQWKLHELPKAVRNVRSSAPELNSAHPALLCNPDHEPMSLDYDRPTILPITEAVIDRPPLPFSSFVQTMHGSEQQATASIPPTSARIPTPGSRRPCAR